MGVYYELLEYEKDLHSWIKELEEDRCKTDLINNDKYKALYDVYYGVRNEINSYYN
ncbi:MAG: hypothetical protein E6356_16910 [Terrisporobacter othiniensis]|nr:hypothetical protein [Terrisporobacter othiniensis]